jgi:hypothetical protein
MIPKSGVAVFGQRSCAEKEAKRRKAHANHWPCFDGARQRAFSEPARLPALHRGSCHFSCPKRLSSRPCFPGYDRNGRYPSFPTSRYSDSTSRTGPSAGGNDAQSRPGEGCMHPPAGTALAPSFESALAKGVLVERDSGQLVTYLVTIVNGRATNLLAISAALATTSPVSTVLRTLPSPACRKRRG